MLKIGCDPEFVFRNSNGEMVNADTILQNGDMGLDGHRATGELRPKAANDSLQLVANIRKLIKKGMEHDDVRKLDMLAGHYKFDTSIGGHIHVSGFPMNMETLSNNLDAILMPLSNQIDNLREKSDRKKSGYGDGGVGYRVQAESWIEYRRPGSWLLSPQVAFINLWLAEAVSYAYMSKDTEVLSQFRERRNILDALIKFGESMDKVPHQDIFIKVADNLFSNLPLDWDADMKSRWE